jgi:diguanylate cyclase (GGDEF)-like protein
VATLWGVSPGAKQRNRRTVLLTVLLALAGAVVVGGADTGSAFFLCLPVVLLASTLPRRAIGAFSASGVVVVASALPSAWLSRGALPAPALIVLVPLASVGVLAGIRARLERERDALRDVALTDPLTGLANRRLLMARADYEIARHTRHGESFAVVMLDLDGFKALNDRFGHAAGDELLCDVASGLTHAVRAQDTVARLGGDEFCVLAPQTGRDATQPLMTRIEPAVTRATAGVETLRASVGIAVFPEDGRTASTLLHRADERLLEAKRNRPRHMSRRRAA